MPAFRTTRSTGTSGTPRTFASAAAVALAALALTACQNGTGTKDEGAARPSGTVTSTPSESGTGKTHEGTSGGGTSGAPGQGSGQTGDGTSEGHKSGGATGNGSGGADKTSDTSASDKRVLCNGSNTKVTARTVSRPLNHMLITVRNTGSKTCDLPYYPVLRFDEMQWAPTAMKDTQPQAVVTLTPGESGYAGALLSAADGSGEGGETGHRLTVAFQGLTPNSSGGASAVPTLPAKGVYYDSSLTVTYWQQDMADALSS